MREWKWKVSCYYSEAAKKPKVPGALAIETVHETDHSRDMEIAAAQSRENIGRILITPISRRN